MENKIKEFAKKVEIVKEFLNSTGFDFMVVGSGALLIHGLPISRNPHDIDIEVRCEDETILKALSNAYGNTFYKIKECYPEIGEHKPYIFQIRYINNVGIKHNILVNAWAVREFSHPYSVTYENVKYAPIQSVLERKMLLQRTKDFKDLNSIISNINELLILDKSDLLKRISKK